jgi:hypothetical protein
MFYLILVGLFLIPIAIIGGFIYAYKKLPHSYFLLLLISLITLIYVGNYLYDKKTIIDNIPNSFSIKKSLSISYNMSIRDDYYCGLGVFELSENTINKINGEGLKFLNSNLNPRNDENGRHEYPPWTQIPNPIPENWGTEGGIFPSYCTDANKELLNKITAAVKEPGGFYTSGGGYGGGYILYVIPKSGILIAKVFIM